MPPRTTTKACCLRAKVPQCISQQRSFHVKPDSVASTIIPPESPRFIEVPKPVQESAFFKPYRKGILPIPRSVFPHKQPILPKIQKDKTSKEYLNLVAAYPQSKKPLPTDPVSAEHVSYKQRLAAIRRESLRQSLAELQRRKENSERLRFSRANANQAKNRALRKAPERDDERFTNPSVTKIMRPASKGPIPDPHREARVEQKHANVAATEARKLEDRRSQLHTLYMNARQFITTLKHAEYEIDQAFDDTTQFMHDNKPGLNVWNFGAPETTGQLMARRTKPQSNKMGFGAVNEGHAPLTKATMKASTEELTGGKK